MASNEDLEKEVIEKNAQDYAEGAAATKKARKDSDFVAQGEEERHDLEERASSFKAEAEKMKAEALKEQKAEEEKRNIAKNANREYNADFVAIQNDLTELALSTALKLYNRQGDDEAAEEVAIILLDIARQIDCRFKGESGIKDIDSNVSPQAVVTAYAAVIACGGGFNIDTNIWEEFVSKNPSLGDEESKGIGFGFAELNAIVYSVAGDALHLDNANMNGEAIGNGLLGYLRDDESQRDNPARYCKPEDYVGSLYAKHDLDLITFLLTRSDEGSVEAEEEWRELVEDFSDLSAEVSNAILDIKNTYTTLFEDSFGLHPHAGVMVDGSKSVESGINGKRKKKIVEGTYALRVDSRQNVMRILPIKQNIMNKQSFWANGYATLVKGLGDVEISDSRQFDVEKILKSDKPVYFPKKILEIQSGCMSTYNLRLDVYQRSPADSWESYWSMCIEPYFTKMFRQVIINAQDECLDDDGTVNHEKLVKLARIYIDKLRRSVCAAFLVTEFRTIGSQMMKVAVRVADVTHKLQATSGTTRIIFNIDSSKKDIQEPYEGTNGKSSIKVYTFVYDSNPELSNKEPIFAYKGVLSFLKQHRKIQWSSVLFGEDEQGRTVEEGKQIELSKNVVHNIYAGSRSGKGLMTMTLLASALASKKAVFYIDRKPDMASMFAKITAAEGGLPQMFVFNGGGYGGTDDTYQSLTASSPVGKKFAKAQIPDFFSQISETKFKSPQAMDTTPSGIRDFVYLRAIMFLFSILEARIRFRGEDKSVYDKLGGLDGVVFVIDETTNWITLFESELFDVTKSTGAFVAVDNVISETTGKSKEQQAYEDAVAELEEIKEQYANDPKGKSKIDTAERKKNQKKRAWDNSVGSNIDPRKAYCTQLMECLKAVWQTMNAEKNAGFQQLEDANTDIFVLGQLIPLSTGEGLDGTGPDTWYKRNKSDGGYSTTGKGKSVLRAILDQFKSDWFIGANLNNADLVAQMEKAGLTRLVCTERSFWAYYPQCIKPDVTKPKCLFKPFLVLNNNEECSSKHEKAAEPATATYVNQCSGRVGNDLWGNDLWGSVRYDNRAEKYADLSEEDFNKIKVGPGGEPTALHRGVGFKGLAELVAETTGETIDYIEILKKSGSIANYVANCCGYSDFYELLFDLRPEGLFAPEHIVEAIRRENKEAGAGGRYFHNVGADGKNLTYIIKYGGQSGVLNTEDEEAVDGNGQMAAQGQRDAMDIMQGAIDVPLDTDLGEDDTSAESADSVTGQDAYADNAADTLKAPELAKIRNVLEQFAIDLYSERTGKAVSGLVERKLKLMLAKPLASQIDGDMQVGSIKPIDFWLSVPEKYRDSGIDITADYTDLGIEGKLLQNMKVLGLITTVTDEDTNEDAVVNENTDTDTLNDTTINSVLIAWVDKLYESEGYASLYGNLDMRFVEATGSVNDARFKIRTAIANGECSVADFWLNVPSDIRQENIDTGVITADVIVDGTPNTFISDCAYAILDSIVEAKDRALNDMGRGFAPTADTEVPVTDDTATFNAELDISLIRQTLTEVFDKIAYLITNNKITVYEEMRDKIVDDTQRGVVVEALVSKCVEYCKDDSVDFTVAAFTEQMTEFKATLDSLGGD